MTDLWFALLLKSSIVLAVGCICAWAARSRSAAVRHCVWISTISALLILFAGLLIPDATRPFSWTIPTSSVALSGPRTAGNAGLNVTTFATTLWGAGVAIMLLRLIHTAVRARGIVLNASCVERMNTCQILVTDAVSCPVAWSFGRGSVVLPKDAETWTPDARQAAIAHELAHVKRRDCEALLAADIARSIYWFHPLVWYAVRRMRIEQEHAADDHALQTGLEPVAYVNELLNIARWSREEQLLPGTGTKSALAGRVKTILDTKRKRTMVTRRMVFASLAAALAVAVPVTAMQAQRNREVYRIGGNVTAPKIVHKTEPEYTQEAKDAKIEGSVLLSVIVEADGSILEAEVQRSLDLGLDRAAVEAVKQWVFRPAEKDGVPVAVSARIEVNFRLV